MAQQVQHLLFKPKDLISIPQTHVEEGDNGLHETVVLKNPQSWKHPACLETSRTKVCKNKVRAPEGFELTTGRSLFHSSPLALVPSESFSSPPAMKWCSYSVPSSPSHLPPDVPPPTSTSHALFGLRACRAIPGLHTGSSIHSPTCHLSSACRLAVLVLTSVLVWVVWAEGGLCFPDL